MVNGGYLDFDRLRHNGFRFPLRERHESLVNDMKGTSRPLGPEFGPFLYASVGEEGNGMTLSVLSTLARRDLDPWKEAADLAALPIDVATRRLAPLITGLTGAAGHLEPSGAATRLVLLLPQHASLSVPPRTANVDDTLGVTRGSLVIWMILISLTMGTQVLTARWQPSIQTKQATAAAATAGRPAHGPL